MDKKIKVLMIGPARSVNGGISGMINNYYNAGLGKQIDLTYIGTMEDGSKIHKLFVAAKALLKYIMVVAKFDIVHVNMASDISIYRKMPFIQLAALYKKKIIIHQHGGHIDEFYYRICNDRQKKQIRRVIDKADKMLVVAPHLKEIFGNIIDDSKIIVFPNTIKVPQEYEKDYSKQKIIFMGRLCKEKGIRELLDAVSELKKQFPRLQVYLGGIWVDDDLKVIANRYNEWIHQLGWIDNKEKDKYLRECNIFVLPTYFEGMPVSLLEGMSFGCACVATNVGGIPDVLISEETGLLIPSKDTKALIEALKKMLEDTSLQKKCGMAARTEIYKKYNLDNSINELVQIYHNVIRSV